MAPDETFLTLNLPVELLAKTPHFIAVGLSGLFCLLFQSLDFFPTLGKFTLKPLGLAAGEAVGEIAEGILAVGITLGFCFGRLPQCRLLLFSRRLCLLGVGRTFINQL